MQYVIFFGCYNASILGFNQRKLCWFPQAMLTLHLCGTILTSNSNSTNGVSWGRGYLFLLSISIWAKSVSKSLFHLIITTVQQWHPLNLYWQTSVRKYKPYLVYGGVFFKRWYQMYSIHSLFLWWRQCDTFKLYLRQSGFWKENACLAHWCFAKRNASSSAAVNSVTLAASSDEGIFSDKNKNVLLWNQGNSC